MREPEQTRLVGNSRSIVNLRAEVDRVALSDARVLITGESGVGKEIVARAIFAGSPRSNAPFVPVNCASIPEPLLESELFGHVKGSFTGAFRDKPGRLESAAGGTIFLDEVGEMSLRMQGLFLRFLETGEIQKVGAERIITSANVRVISATNRDLHDQIVQGQFREDLFYRLNVIHLVVPALRDRPEDIPLLVEHFLARFTSPGHPRYGNGNGHATRVKAIAPDAMEAMMRYLWPGNVRQLENVVERFVVTAPHEVVQVQDLPLELHAPAQARVRPRQDRRHTVTDDLYEKLVDERESFWSAVYPLYMGREITKGNIRDLVHRGLSEARGNYRIVLKMFNMETTDYKRFLNFLRKHDCQLPYKDYRL